MTHRFVPSRAALLGLLSAVVVAAGGCGEAFTLTGGTGGSGGAGSTVSAASATATSTATTSSGASGCDTNESCGAGKFCLKMDCSGGATGTCESVASSHLVFEPVCGCDGVSFWNSIYGAASSKPIRKVGACGAAEDPKLCDASGGCNNSEHCALSRKSCIDVTAKGTCWVVPDPCEGTTVGVTSCNSATPGECQNVCSLITDGKPFKVGTSCTPP